MTEIVRIKVITETGYVGGDHEDEIEFDRATWDGMSDDEREREILECGMEHITITGTIVDEDGNPTGEDI